MKNIGIKIPEILLPYNQVDYFKWAIVACDQFTSQPDYWSEVEKIVNDEVSTLNLIFPEVFLKQNEEDIEKRIQIINDTMEEYLQKNILERQKPGFIYTERTTKESGKRKGLILSVDLEKYEFQKGSKSLIRATEDTIIERLPPRVKIRKNASIEIPHIMLLIDDPKDSIFSIISDNLNSLEKLYDFDLMKGGGNLKGYSVQNSKVIDKIIEGFSELATEEVFKKKYNTEEDVLLFAVGDGNHSLATAKLHWENIKKNSINENLLDHPSRYALVEVVNLHDSGLKLSPIHRVIFNIDEENLYKNLLKYLENRNVEFNSTDVEDIRNISEDKINSNEFIFTTNNYNKVLRINNMEESLIVTIVEDFIQNFIKNNLKADVDYIHGEEETIKLARLKNNAGIILPSIEKSSLFKTVINDGKLPRKTFSMGEANEKKYYVESRMIK